jgi:hypothetical protein
MYGLAMSRGVLVLVNAGEDRHYKEPPAGKLVIAHNSVTVVAGLTNPTEACPESIGCDRAV